MHIPTLFRSLVVFDLLMSSMAFGQVQIAIESAPSEFQFKTVPPPAKNDLATRSTFKVLRGEIDPNSIGLEALHNDKTPVNEDQPDENFFLAAGSTNGCLEIDFGRVVSIKQFTSYSWHATTRAAQVYRLYGATGDEEGLSHTLTPEVDIPSRGWSLIADIDSRAESQLGNQHGVSISSSDNSLGRYRYLLLDISPTETDDAFGNTFFSEIDIYDADGEAPTPIDLPSSRLIAFATSDEKYQFTIDAAEAPDLQEWCSRELRPVIETWYPKIVELLPSEGFQAPRRVQLRFQDQSRMRGNPAYASGTMITLNAQWFRRELKREARGAVVHEMAHVVQSYNFNRRRSPTKLPGWIVEGIPDYIRWFLYEPESHGAEITEQALPDAKYDASYRVTGNFFDFLVRTYDQDFITKLNAAARQGRYDSNFWMETFGKTLPDLEKEWKTDCQRRLNDANGQ